MLVNPPLDFTLRHLDAAHPYLAACGLTAETVAHFGLGFCGRGLLRDRIAVPLHDERGTLVGYAGRVVDDDLVDGQTPKYLFPSVRERGGVRIEFRKGRLLFNAHRVARPVDDLIVVEGPMSVLHLHQLGHANAVALMGSSCSPEQARLIAELVRDGGRVWVIPDGDPAGTRCAASVLGELAPLRFCRWVRLPDGRQPTDLDEQELCVLTSVEAEAAA